MCVIKFHKVPELFTNRKVRTVRTEQLCLAVSAPNCTKIQANRSICVVTAVCFDLVCRYCGLPWHTCSYCCLPCFSSLFTYLIRNNGVTLQASSSWREQFFWQNLGQFACFSLPSTQRCHWLNNGTKICIFDRHCKFSRSKDITGA